MSGTSSYKTFDSEDESTGWLLTSETSLDDGLSDELTLLNGDEDCDEDTLSFEALIKLSMRLKKRYNLREATVQLERCDKIWDTMQLVKKIQMDYESESTLTGDEDETRDEKKPEPTTPIHDSRMPERAFATVPYIKYQPVQGVGNNLLPNFYLAVKSQKKLYNCLTCGKQYGESRGLTLHSQKEHGLVQPKAARKRRRRTTTVDTKNGVINDCIDVKPYAVVTTESTTATESPSTMRTADDKSYVCGLCKSSHVHRRGLTRHMMVVHAMTLEQARAKYRNDIIVSMTATTTTMTTTTTTIPRNDEQHTKILRKKKKSCKPKEYRYVWTCTPCGRKFNKKKHLGFHLREKHKIYLPDERGPRWLPGETVKEYGFYKCEIVRPRYKLTPRKIVTNEKPRETRLQSKTNDRRKRTTRSGRRVTSSPIVDRPRRACAMNTSYRECTKEEEELLQRALTDHGSVDPTETNSNDEKTLQCFLCKKPFVDLRRHLVDYHRINTPDMIIPMTGSDDNREIVVTSTIAEIVDDERSNETLEISRERDKTRDYAEKLKEAECNPHVKILRCDGTQTNGIRTLFQCLICLYKFNRLHNSKQHYDRWTKDGVMIDHPPPKPVNYKLQEQNFPDDPDVDPLSIQDSGDSEIIVDHEIDEDEDRDVVEKRRFCSTEESKILEFGERTKRRKIISDDCENETIVDNVDRNGNNPLMILDTDCGSNEEDKSLKFRDTRDSSDRDSGIGISITIKKRNNSYEVVDKDSGDDDKSKDSENSKDTSSDTSSGATPIDFANDGREDARREIDPLIVCVAEKGNGRSGTIDYSDDRAFEKKIVDDGVSTENNDADYCWTESKRYEGGQCTNLSDFVRPGET